MSEPTAVKTNEPKPTQRSAGEEHQQQGIAAPAGSAYRAAMALQDAAGNRAVSQLLADRPGQPLEPPTRAWMEARFQQDFGQVRVYTGPEAATAAKRQKARAYTLGNDIVFNAGQYQPQSTVGRHLLAHELAHVVQQRSQRRGSVTGRPIQATWLEGQAESAARSVILGQHVPTQFTPAPHAIQRSPEGDEGGFTQASKSVAKVPLFKWPTRVGEISVKLAVAPASAGKDPHVPKSLTPEMELEITKKVSFKLKTDVFRHDFDVWSGKLAGLGFKGDFITEFLEAEVASGAMSLSVVKLKGKFQSTDVKQFGATVALELELKVKPENLLRGKDRALLKQFQKLTEKLQNGVQEIAENSEKLKKAETALQQAEEKLQQNRSQAEQTAKKRRGKGKQRQKLNRQVKRELKKLDDAAEKLKNDIKLRKRQVKNLQKSIRKGKGIIRRTAQQISKVVRSSKNPVFRLLTKGMMKAAGKLLARFIPVLNILTIGYDVVVLLRNLALGRLSWNPAGDGDPWGDGIGQPGQEGAADAGPAPEDAASGGGQTDAAQGQKGEGQGDKAAGEGTADQNKTESSGGDQPADGGQRTAADDKGDASTGAETESDAGTTPGPDAQAGGTSAGTPDQDGGVGQQQGQESTPDAGGETSSEAQTGTKEQSSEGGGTATSTERSTDSTPAEESVDGGTGKNGGKKAKAESSEEAEPAGAKSKGKKGKKGKKAGGGAPETIPGGTTIFPVLSGFDPNKSYPPGQELTITGTFHLHGKTKRKRFVIVIDSEPSVQDGEKRQTAHNKTTWTLPLSKDITVTMEAGEPIELITTLRRKQKKRK